MLVLRAYIADSVQTLSEFLEFSCFSLTIIQDGKLWARKPKTLSWESSGSYDDGYYKHHVRAC